MDDLTLAHRLADHADAVTLRHAAGSVSAEFKRDGSPVTEADREVEDMLRAQLARQRPHDAFLGEERGAHGAGPRRWIVDAVDGTASFVAGRPEWGTLIALEERGRVTTGLVSAPALGRRWWAELGHGAWTCPLPRSADQRPDRVEVTPPTGLSTATIGIWPPPTRLSAPDRALAATLASHAGAVRPALDWSRAEPGAATVAKPSTGSGTCHGGLLVASGQLDAFLLLGAGAWDIAALIPIVQEAGGTYTHLTEASRSDTESALFASMGLREQILDVLRTALRNSSAAKEKPPTSAADTPRTPGTSTG